MVCVTDASTVDDLQFEWFAWASKDIAHDPVLVALPQCPEQHGVAINDPVFVRLGPKRGCHGIVESIKAEADKAAPSPSDEKQEGSTASSKRRLRIDGKGRSCQDVTVNVDENSEVACGQDRLTRVISGGIGSASRDQPAVIVVADTLEFRHLARSQVFRDDHVIEVGSSTGLTTSILHESAASVLGLDVSLAQIQEAKTLLPQVSFEFLHLFEEPDRLRAMPEAERCTVAFMDIGGDREWSHVLQGVDLLRRQCLPNLRLLVVKSEEVHAAMTAWGYDGFQRGACRLRSPADFLLAPHASRRRGGAVVQPALGGAASTTASGLQQKKKRALCSKASQGYGGGNDTDKSLQVESEAVIEASVA